MHPQLEEIERDYGAAGDRVRRLASRLTDEQWRARPADGRWSPAECIAHLNLTAEAFLPDIRAGVERARSLGGRVPARFGRGVMGWLLWKIMPPPVKLRVPTSPAFVPTSDQAPTALVARFEELQRQQLELLRAADGLPIHRVRLPSPFNARVKYNLFATFGILSRHALRHVWQAEETVKDL